MEKIIALSSSEAEIHMGVSAHDMARVTDVHVHSRADRQRILICGLRCTYHICTYCLLLRHGRYIFFVSSLWYFIVPYNTINQALSTTMPMRGSIKSNPRLLIRPVALLLLGMMPIRSCQALATTKGTALVTGSTDGIGVTTAKNLFANGYDVLIHGRDEKRIRAAEETVRAFGEGSNARVRVLPATDLSTVQGCRQLASDAIRVCKEEGFDLKVLMNNAGVYSEDHVVTSDGTEFTFAVNVVAPFVITSRLLPIMLGDGQKDRRVVIASSLSQCGSIRHWDDLAYRTRPYSAHGAYSESKLLDAMLTFEFAERFKNKGIGTDVVTCNCLDPGTVNTKVRMEKLFGLHRIGLYCFNWATFDDRLYGRLHTDIRVVSRMGLF